MFNVITTTSNETPAYVWFCLSLGLEEDTNEFSFILLGSDIYVSKHLLFLT